MDIDELKEREMPEINRLLTFLRSTTYLLQVSLLLMVQFTRSLTEGDDPDLIEFPIRASSGKIFSGETQRDHLDNSFDLFEERIQDMCERGSNWILSGFLSLAVEVGKCRSLFGGYSGNSAERTIASMTINNVEDLELKTKMTNVPSDKDDGECFFRCLALYYLGNTFNEESYQKFKKDHFNMNIPCPVEIKAIRQFERANQHLNAQINVFTQNQSNLDLYPLYLSPFGGKHQINLLLFFSENKDHASFPAHFLLIKSINRLVQRRYDSSQGKKANTYSKDEICLNCMTKFSNKTVFENHLRHCKIHGAHLLKDTGFPIKYFNKWVNKFKKPVVGFLDFESRNEWCPQQKKTLQFPISFSLIFVGFFGELLCEYTFAGDDTSRVFLEKLIESEKIVKKYLYQNVPLDWKNVPKKEKENFYSPDAKCHICEKKFYNDATRHKDHCHYSGKFFGPAHEKCNLHRHDKKFKKIPIFCHNSQNYDFKIVIAALKYKPFLDGLWNVELLSKNGEKMVAIYLNDFVLSDSFSFLPSSLEKVVESTLQSRKELPILAQSGMYKNEKERQLLLAKGTFCYDYVKSFDQIRSCGLPQYDEFYSTLTQSNVSPKDYAHAKTVYKTFGCKNLLDYMVLYNRLDTYLLAECFENFREVALKEFHLDPARYLSLPGFSLDAMFYMTKARVRLIEDPEMYLCLERGIRGGLSFVGERYLAASPEMTDDEFEKLSENEKEKVNRIIYIDQNNLYGNCLRKYHAVGSYKWLTQNQISKIDWANLSSESNTGYILQVDIEYPDFLHKDHESLPICPEHKDINYHDLSEYSKLAYEKIYGSSSKVFHHKSKKLTVSFETKYSYVIHYNNLKEYMKLGLKLLKIHRVISFEQRPFMRPYVDKCTQMRKMATTLVEKNLMKLALNACYGKCLESQRNRLYCRVTSNANDLERRFSSEFFDSFKILDENLVLCFKKMRNVYMQNMLFIGLSVLEYSKTEMMVSYYSKLRPMLGQTSRVCAMDTDSFFIRVSAPNHEYCMRKLAPLMDFSNYEKDHPLYDKTHQNELGRYKDETAGKPILQFVGLRSKVYCFETKNEVKKICKGIQKRSKQHISIETYKKCLKNFSTVRVNQRSIRSKNQQLFLHVEKKVAFSSADDKMKIKMCKIHSVPFGSIHYEKENVSCSICNSSK